jgi:hypothetical protein
MPQRDLRSHEHYYASDILDHGRFRVSRFANNPDLGMGTMGKAAEIPDDPGDPIHDQFCSCDS